MKINELKRVVDVDKFNKYAMKLKDKSTDENEVDRILNELGKKTPSRDVLMKTKLGFVLKEISERESLPKSIRDKSKQLRTKWKDFHKRLLLAPKYDVKCDKPTTENRERAKQALDNALKRAATTALETDAVSTIALVANLEFEIFQHCDKLVNGKYFNTVRCCIKLLTEKDSLRRQFLTKKLTATELVADHLSGDVFKQFKLDVDSSTTGKSSEPIDDDFIESIDV